MYCMEKCYLGKVTMRSRWIQTRQTKNLSNELTHQSRRGGGQVRLEFDEFVVQQIHSSTSLPIWQFVRRWVWFDESKFDEYLYSQEKLFFCWLYHIAMPHEPLDQSDSFKYHIVMPHEMLDRSDSFGYWNPPWTDTFKHA